MKLLILNQLNKFLILFLALFISGMPAFAYELDMSVDEEIKKKYNSSKLNYDVPALPKVEVSCPSAQSKTPVPKTKPVYSTVTPSITKIDKKDAIIISKWTKFQVKSNQIISDSTKVGTGVSFTTVLPIYKKYITIPTGARLNGVVLSSHNPQFSGNGGQISIKITSLTFNGKTYYVNGKVTKANHKKIFFNNIKGKHQYWRGVNKQVNKGTNFYNKTRTLSKKWADNPILVILSPVPTIVGIAGSVAVTIISPVTGMIYKGGKLSIPTGSSFELKLLEDAYISM